MDEFTQENIRDISPRSEFASLLSTKRPRIDYMLTNAPDILTFKTTIGSPPAISIWQHNADVVCTAELGDIEDEKPDEKEATKLIDTRVTKLTTSHADDAHTGLSTACSIAAERRFLRLAKDEHLQVTESDKLRSYPPDDAGAALAESHTSQDTDTSCHSDCKWLGESLEHEPPGGCNLLAASGEDARQVHDSPRKTQAFSRSSGDEDVRCHTDEDMLHDTGFCNTWNQLAVEESDQRRGEHGFSANMLFIEEKEEGNSALSSSDYAGMKSFYSNPVEDSSGNLTEGVKNEEEILELQICENDNVAVCDVETKGQVNENGPSANAIPSAAECAEGSIVSDDVVSARNVAVENARLEAGVFCGAEGEHAAGMMIAKARSETADHTTETPTLARISQEAAEGDNDGGPFSVIDPAIWSEADRAAEEKLSNSEHTADAELSPSVKVCEMEMPHPLRSDVRPSQEVSAPGQTWQFNHQSRTQQCKDEKDDLCQSYAEPRACSIITNEMQTGSEGSCLWKSSPSCSPKFVPAGDGRQETHETVGHRLKEQDEHSYFAVRLGHLKTQEAEYLQAVIGRMDEARQIKEREGATFFEDDTDEHGKSKNSVDLVEQLQHKEDTTEISAGDSINGSTVGGISKRGSKATHIDKVLGGDPECSTVTPIMEGKTEEIQEETDDGHQRQSPRNMTEVSPGDCTCEWTEDDVSNKSARVSQDEQGSTSDCFSDHQHTAETFMLENKDDLLAFPVTSDAVVPGPHAFNPSQNAYNEHRALNCSDRFPPSAFTFCSRMLGGFDTFEKIRLSLHDDDDNDDGGLSNSPVLISLPGQLLKTQQRQLHHSVPEADCSKHREVPEEEGVERSQCHTENMANGFLSSDYRCNELPNFISAVDVAALGCPGQQLGSESACNSSECFPDDFSPQPTSTTVSSDGDRPASDVNDSPKFEMNEQFNKVLKELKLYFDISMSDFMSEFRASSPERCSDVTKALEDDTLNCKEQPSSPRRRHHRDTSSDDADEERGLCGGDPVVRGDGEQQVPLGSQEASMYAVEKDREPQEMEQKRKTCSPSFVNQPFLEQLSRGPKRLGPLRTCTRPIRVGLSKRAKTKRLHCPHPYK